MLFDKNLFESKYVPAEQRTPVDTLILIGNGFDIWQNLDTSYRSFERYYEAHLDEVLERFHLKNIQNTMMMEPLQLIQKAIQLLIQM